MTEALRRTETKRNRSFRRTTFSHVFEKRGTETVQGSRGQRGQAYRFERRKELVSDEWRDHTRSGVHRMKSRGERRRRHGDSHLEKPRVPPIE